MMASSVVNQTVIYDLERLVTVICLSAEARFYQSSQTRNRTYQLKERKLLTLAFVNVLEGGWVSYPPPPMSY